MAKPQSDILIGELLKEYQTVAYMMRIYCQNHHQREQGEALCTDCQQLLDYAEVRLDRCPYGQSKPTCNRCPIHCYKPEPKADMKAVMRFSGPRMLLPHPILAIRHLLHERRPVPTTKPAANQSNRHQRSKK
ncbi:nitrous oxide-stimulated promoter [Vibrio panuliri]|uniref:Nitrous oxide-stimulated promoter n=1 Tax=Vibrio panuliri TaxID=1381081 RepID=A0A1Q9HFW2_9VIBR|nr:nitrous oxide-stimulated promoter family protein [Vibrio panuliri]OLQ88596.1 nitrous oxide-stimulated promoter [Vibrio panuliri]